MAIGRFICVVVPFALTLASLVAILVAMLGGVTDKSLYLMEISTQNVSISTSDLASLGVESLVTRSVSGLIEAALSSASTSGNLTASDLGLANDYDISLWGYCAQKTANRTCTSAAYNWASSATNLTTYKASLGSAAAAITIPTKLSGTLNTFSKVMYWTEIVYTVAAVSTALELIVGFFALCSRIGSCCTFLVSGFSSIAIIAASILATVLTSVTIGAIEGVAAEYGVDASFNTRFLATTWIAVAFSIGSSIFWMLSICCCAPSKKSHARSFSPDGAAVPLAASAAPIGGYQPVSAPWGEHPGNNYAHGGYQVPMAQVKNARQTAGAYEPYSHGTI